MMLPLEDRLEIAELHARYNRAVDTGDAEGWAACFTPDGIFDARSRYAKGIAELVAFARFYHGQEAYRGAVHWNNNIVADGDGSEARVHADYILVRGSDEGVQILSSGAYASVARKVDGRWLFASRKSIVTSAANELQTLFER
jgi:uncharacterized protein (TIGR02246 family)